MRALTTAMALLVVLAAPPLAAQTDPIAGCSQSRQATLRMQSCSQIIAGSGFTREQRALAYRNRGLARSDAGARQEALADFAEALKLNGSDASSYAGRAAVRLSQGAHDEAIADFDAAIRIAPHTASTYIGRGHAYLVKGDADCAIQDFSAAIRISPGNAIAYNNRGLAWRRKGDLDRAIADYDQAIQLNPIYALAYNNRGYAYEGKGLKDEAVADYRRALLLDRSLAGATEALKRLKVAGPMAADSERMIAEGKALVETGCASCHAVGPSGDSPNAMAPRLRMLQQRHPVRALREPLTRAIAAPHDTMPRFAFADGDIDKIVAYINTLETTPAPARK